MPPMHTARLGLLALLVFAAVVNVSADLTEAVAVVKGLKGSLQAVKAALGHDRADAKAFRAGVSACWVGKALTCKAAARCMTSKCSCCGCPCATLTCFFNTVKASFDAVEKMVPLLKTPAQRKAVASSYCVLARTWVPMTREFISLYKTYRCPGYTKNVKALEGYQKNFSKWCKLFSG